MTELLISERIRKYRKKADITQEALAQALGVSSQAVSKWETGEGYPDITLLPRLAGYFGITIDELMGVDEAAIEEDKRKFYQAYYTTWPREKSLPLAIEYYRKYPKDYYIAHTVSAAIATLKPEKQAEYMPLMREICERIRNECTDSILRRDNVRYMCMICEDSELDMWLKDSADPWLREDNRVMEERARVREGEQSEAYKALYDAGNYIATSALFQHLDQHPAYYGKPELSVACNSMRLRMIEFFAGSPMEDGWVMEYFISKLRLSAALLGLGKTEEGFAALREAADLWQRWCAIPNGAELSLGNPELFGQTRLVKGENAKIILANGKQIESYPDYLNTGGWGGFDLYDILTRPKGWEWFNSVREDPRFLAIVEEAKSLTKAE